MLSAPLCSPTLLLLPSTLPKPLPTLQSPSPILTLHSPVARVGSEWRPVPDNRVRVREKRTYLYSNRNTNDISVAQIRILEERSSHWH